MLQQKYIHVKVQKQWLSVAYVSKCKNSGCQWHTRWQDSYAGPVFDTRLA